MTFGSSPRYSHLSALLQTLPRQTVVIDGQSLSHFFFGRPTLNLSYYGVESLQLVHYINEFMSPFFEPSYVIEATPVHSTSSFSAPPSPLLVEYSLHSVVFSPDEYNTLLSAHMARHHPRSSMNSSVMPLESYPWLLRIPIAVIHAVFDGAPEPLKADEGIQRRGQSFAQTYAVVASSDLQRYTSQHGYHTHFSSSSAASLDMPPPLSGLVTQQLVDTVASALRRLGASVSLADFEADALLLTLTTRLDADVLITSDSDFFACPDLPAKCLIVNPGKIVVEKPVIPSAGSPESILHSFDAYQVRVREEIAAYKKFHAKTIKDRKAQQEAANKAQLVEQEAARLAEKQRKAAEQQALQLAAKQKKTNRKVSNVEPKNVPRQRAQATLQETPKETPRVTEEQKTLQLLQEAEKQSVLLELERKMQIAIRRAISYSMAESRRKREVCEKNLHLRRIREANEAMKRKIEQDNILPDWETENDDSLADGASEAEKQKQILAVKADAIRLGKEQEDFLVAELSAFGIAEENEKVKRNAIVSDWETLKLDTNVMDTEIELALARVEDVGEERARSQALDQEVSYLTKKAVQMRREKEIKVTTHDTKTIQPGGDIRETKAPIPTASLAPLLCPDARFESTIPPFSTFIEASYRMIPYPKGTTERGSGSLPQSQCTVKLTGFSSKLASLKPKSGSTPHFLSRILQISTCLLPLFAITVGSDFFSLESFRSKAIAAFNKLPRSRQLELDALLNPFSSAASTSNRVVQRTNAFQRAVKMYPNVWDQVSEDYEFLQLSRKQHFSGDIDKSEKPLRLTESSSFDPALYKYCVTEELFPAFVAYVKGPELSSIRSFASSAVASALKQRAVDVSNTNINVNNNSNTKDIMAYGVSPESVYTYLLSILAILFPKSLQTFRDVSRSHNIVPQDAFIELFLKLYEEIRMYTLALSAVSSHQPSHGAQLGLYSPVPLHSAYGTKLSGATTTTPITSFLRSVVTSHFSISSSIVGNVTQRFHIHPTLRRRFTQSTRGNTVILRPDGNSNYGKDSIENEQKQRPISSLFAYSSGVSHNPYTTTFSDCFGRDPCAVLREDDQASVNVSSFDSLTANLNERSLQLDILYASRESMVYLLKAKENGYLISPTYFNQLSHFIEEQKGVLDTPLWHRSFCTSLYSQTTSVPISLSFFSPFHFLSYASLFSQFTYPLLSQRTDLPQNSTLVNAPMNSSAMASLSTARFRTYTLFDVQQVASVVTSRLHSSASDSSHSSLSCLRAKDLRVILAPMYSRGKTEKTQLVSHTPFPALVFDLTPTPPLVPVSVARYLIAVYSNCVDLGWIQASQKDMLDDLESVTQVNEVSANTPSLLYLTTLSQRALQALQATPSANPDVLTNSYVPFTQSLLRLLLDIDHAIEFAALRLSVDNSSVAPSSLDEQFNIHVTPTNSGGKREIPPRNYLQFDQVCSLIKGSADAWWWVQLTLEMALLDGGREGHPSPTLMSETSLKMLKYEEDPNADLSLRFLPPWTRSSEFLLTPQGGLSPTTTYWLPFVAYLRSLARIFCFQSPVVSGLHLAQRLQTNHLHETGTQPTLERYNYLLSRILNTIFFTTIIARRILYITQQLAFSAAVLDLEFHDAMETESLTSSDLRSLLFDQALGSFQGWVVDAIAEAVDNSPVQAQTLFSLQETNTTTGGRLSKSEQAWTQQLFHLILQSIQHTLALAQNTASLLGKTPLSYSRTSFSFRPSLLEYGNVETSSGPFSSFHASNNLFSSLIFQRIVLKTLEKSTLEKQKLRHERMYEMQREALYMKSSPSTFSASSASSTSSHATLTLLHNFSDPLCPIVIETKNDNFYSRWRYDHYRYTPSFAYRGMDDPWMLEEAELVHREIRHYARTLSSSTHPDQPILVPPNSMSSQSSKKLAMDITPFNSEARTTMLLDTIGENIVQKIAHAPLTDNSIDRQVLGGFQSITLLKNCIQQKCHLEGIKLTSPEAIVMQQSSSRLAKLRESAFKMVDLPSLLNLVDGFSNSISDAIRNESKEGKYKYINPSLSTMTGKSSNAECAVPSYFTDSLRNLRRHTESAQQKYYNTVSPPPDKESKQHKDKVSTAFVHLPWFVALGKSHDAFQAVLHDVYPSLSSSSHLFSDSASSPLSSFSDASLSCVEEANYLCAHGIAPKPTSAHVSLCVFKQLRITKEQRRTCTILQAPIRGCAMSKDYQPEFQRQFLQGLVLPSAIRDVLWDPMITDSDSVHSSNLVKLKRKMHIQLGHEYCECDNPIIEFDISDIPVFVEFSKKINL